MMQRLNHSYGIDFKKGASIFSPLCIVLGLKQAL